MYNVVIPLKIEEKIKKFIDYYRNTFIRNFTDTWIFYEDKIRESYVDSSKKFQREIYIGINYKLKENIIWKKIETSWYSSMFSIWNYRLKVIYSEEKDEKLRIVEDVEFYKK